MTPQWRLPQHQGLRPPCSFPLNPLPLPLRWVRARRSGRALLLSSPPLPLATTPACRVPTHMGHPRIVSGYREHPPSSLNPPQLPLLPPLPRRRNPFPLLSAPTLATCLMCCRVLARSFVTGLGRPSPLRGTKYTSHSMSPIWCILLLSTSGTPCCSRTSPMPPPSPLRVESCSPQYPFPQTPPVDLLSQRLLPPLALEPPWPITLPPRSPQPAPFLLLHAALLLPGPLAPQSIHSPLGFFLPRSPIQTWSVMSPLWSIWPKWCLTFPLITSLQCIRLKSLRHPPSATSTPQRLVHHSVKS
jgi:hypothetical protein